MHKVTHTDDVPHQISDDDSGYDLSSRGDLTYPIDEVPDMGETIEVAPGVLWARMPLPFALDHINVWLLEDDEGWTIVDTGVRSKEIQAAFRQILANEGGGRPITGVVVTHYHPDHVGNAGWFVREWDVPLHMSRTEFLYCKMMTSEAAGTPPPEALRFYESTGIHQGGLEAYANRRSRGFGFAIEHLPMGYRRLQDGDTLMIGGDEWEVVVGRGHAPEHACLYSAGRKLLLSGDQVLPRITSNVSVHPTEPEANPLRDWIESCADIRSRLPNDVLVLPAHNEPFYGLHERLTDLIDGHEENLRRLYELCAEPKRAVDRDVFEVLFKRYVDDDVLFMAVGESISHFNCLMGRGLVTRQCDEDGVYWYRQREAHALSDAAE